MKGSLIKNSEIYYMCKIVELMRETFVVSMFFCMVVGYSWKDGVIVLGYENILRKRERDLFTTLTL